MKPTAPRLKLPDLTSALTSLQPSMIDQLSRLVAAQSLSGAEQPAVQVAEQEMARLGLPCERIALVDAQLQREPLYSPSWKPDDGRFNLLAVHRGERRPVDRVQPGRSLLFNGHLDVVPTGPESMWRRPPFAPYVDDGWLYGRGSGDMKGGIVCALAAFEALRALGLQPAADVGFNWVLEEECTGNGTLASVLELQKRATVAGSDGHAPFAAVLIPEPLGENLISAQIGVYWMTITLTGRPSHAAYMSSGLNPVEAGFALMQDLKKLETEWNRPSNRHQAFRKHQHPINFNLGHIQGGEWKSSVPCTCELGIRIGVYPGMDIAEAKQIVEARIRANAAQLNRALQVDIDYSGFHAPGCAFDLEHPMFKTLARAHRQVHGQRIQKVATTATTDARHFHLMMNTPVTCYGPLARNIHGIDESVSIESMQRVSTVFALFMAQWCGLEKIRC